MDTEELDGKKSQELSDDNADELNWKDFFGSSVSLAPSLLSIYDHQVNANGSQCESPKSGAQTHTKDEDIDHMTDLDQPAFPYELSSVGHVTASGQLPENKLPGLKKTQMLSAMHSSEQSENGYSDFRKRPLSLRSTSSNSSSSLSLQQHQHKKIARDSLSSKTGPPLPPIFCDSCKLPGLCESPPEANGGSCDCRNVPVHRSKCTDTGWSGSGSQQSPDCLSIVENDGYLYMDIGTDNTWSPDTERGASEKSPLCLCRADSASHIDRVVLEIVETERAYVRDLQDIIQGYIECVAASSGLLSKSDAHTLFGNIEDVFIFHRKFLQELETSATDPIRIADCFVQSSSGFTIYSDYCTNYPRSVGVLTRCMQDHRLADVLKKQQMSLQHGLPLGSYLLKPVQRILKYHLLLQNLLNNFDENQSGYETILKAFESMMGVADQINEMKRAHERSVRIQEIQSLLYDWNRIDSVTYGDLVLEDQFQMFGAKAFRLVWVFRKAVVIAKKREDEGIQIKASIMFSNLMLVETIQRAPLNFHLIPFDNPKVQYTVQARTMEQKRHWCQELKKLILENYEAVIPEKARQLVMMLGKEEEPYIGPDSAAASQVPAKISSTSEQQKSRQRSPGFIPDLGILKLKRGSKVEALGTALPDLDSSWKSENNDVFNQELESKVLCEGFNKDLDQKSSHSMHTSFSLQNVRRPLSTMPLQKLGYSEAEWHSKSGNRCNTLRSKKFLTAESLEKEFTKSDSNFNSSKNLSVKTHDCLRRAASKDSANNSQTPPISEEPSPGDHSDQGLLTTSHLSSDGFNEVGLAELTKADKQTFLQHSLKQDLTDLECGKFHVTISQNKRLLSNDRILQDCLTNQGHTLLNKVKSVDSSLFLKDRFCSSDSLIGNSGIQEPVGNVFVDRIAFLVSDSAGCMESNRLLDRRLARLCTPPRDFGSFVQDVQMSKQHGRTIVHYGTPMRTVEFPNDLCDGMKTNDANATSDLVEKLLQQETSQIKILRSRQSDCQIIDSSVEICKANPRRSTSVQENMVNSCIHISSENSARSKPKRSGSFHGNILYSSINQENADHTTLNSSNAVITEPRASVGGLKHALLSLTGKLSTRRSRNSENHNDPVSVANVMELNGEKTKLKDKVSRLARASYRKIRREKAMEMAHLFDSSGQSTTKLGEVSSAADNELCARTQSVKLKGANILNSYALTMLPRQKFAKHMDRSREELHSNQPDLAIMEKFTREPVVRRPKNCHAAEHQQTAGTDDHQPHDSVVYELQYTDYDNVSGSSVSITNKEAKSVENLDSSQDSAPIKTKACSAISLPGIRNGFVWSSSSFAIDQKEVCMQTSVSTDGRLNCFTAPRGYWIPYIDDSEDE